MYPAGNLFIPAPHGRLEAILKEPRGGAPRATALVLHPHPLHGGTMHNKVVFRTARGLEDAGAVTLRVNFRGVGHSTGEHTGARGGSFRIASSRPCGASMKRFPAGYIRTGVRRQESGVRRKTISSE